MRTLLLLLMTLPLAGCVAYMEHSGGKPWTQHSCDAQWHDYVYTTSKEEAKAFLFYGTVQDVKRARELEGRPWLAEGLMWSVLLWPFATVDLPFSFIAESSIYKNASLKNYNEAMTQCATQSHSDDD